MIRTLALLSLPLLASALPVPSLNLVERKHDCDDKSSSSSSSSSAASNSTVAAAASSDAAANSTSSTAAAGASGSGACPAIALQQYNEFQISDGTGGNAAAEANAVFVDPLAGCDLSTVDATSLSNLDTMAKAAVDAEDTFDSQIDAASGADADALNVGKIKNKVLKLTGEVQVLAIKAAQGDSSATADQATEQTKLTKDIADDQGSAGAASQSVQFSGAANKRARRAPVLGVKVVERKHKSSSSSSSSSTAAANSTAAASTASTAAAGASGSGACPAIALQAYNDFQISDGTGGNAAAEANAVFVDPLAGCDLSTVDATSLSNLDTMAKAAVDAEDTFDSQIDAASGDAADALNVGKIKNKVLKLTGEVQVLAIKAAQGDSSATADQATEQTKLTKDIADDQGSAGAASQSVQFDG